MAGNALTYSAGPLLEETVSNVTATNSVELGTRVERGGKTYVYVYNASSNEQITKNRGVKLASGSTSYSVDVAIAAPTTCSASVLFGVCQNATIPTAYYGWIATRGFLTCENFGLTSIGAGDHVIPYTSGTFHMLTAATWSSSFFLSKDQIACDANATTTTGTFTAYIKTIGA